MEVYLTKNKRFRLKSDQLCAWVEELTKTDPKNKSTKNKERWVNRTGYYGQLDQLLKNVIEAGLLGSDAKTVKELLNEIKEMHKLIDEAIPALQKEFVAKRRKEVK